MKFLFPTFLFALFTIAIPIIIHLFSFKQYKTVYFSNVSFLKNIKKESKKKSRIKQLLLLIARIFALIFLVFAFAQPYLPTNRDTQKKANQIVAIYIDNSFSMNALSEQGQLLEVARNKAVEICLAYPAGTKFRLLTNDLEPKLQHNLNREQFIREVAKIETSPVVIPLSLGYNRFAAQNSTGDTDKNLYIISDFQRSVTDPENFTNKSIFTYYVPLIPNEVANIYIDSCWVEVPAHRLNQEEELFVRIKNSSTQEYNNLPLKLFLNDSIKSITNFSVAPGNEITATLKYSNNTSGLQLGKVEITDYPFTHDNDWYISYFVEPNLKALAIFNDSPSSREGLNYLAALFENDDYILLEQMNINSLQISKLNNYNTIFMVNLETFTSGVLNELGNAVENGTSVVLFPGNTGNPGTNNSLLARFNANLITGIDSTRQEISGVDFESDFYKGVFRKKEENAIMPEISGHLKFEENIHTSENRLLWFQNSDKALSVLNYQKGKFWVFAFPLEKSNQAFARDALFVPTIYNIVLNSLPQQKIAFTVGQNTFYNLPKNSNLNASFEIENLQNGEKFIPARSNSSKGIRLEFTDQINDAGHYLIKSNSTTISAMAFNFNRKESDLRYFASDELKRKSDAAGLNNAAVISDIESNFSEIFDELQNGKQLWRLFIMLALLAIFAEVLIARFWK